MMQRELRRRRQMRRYASSIGSSKSAGKSVSLVDVPKSSDREATKAYFDRLDPSGQLTAVRMRDREPDAINSIFKMPTPDQMKKLRQVSQTAPDTPKAPS